MANYPEKKDDESLKVTIKKAKKGVTGKKESRAAKSFLRTMMDIQKSGSKSSARGRTKGRYTFVMSPKTSSQRVVVKARVVKNSKLSAKGSLRDHVSYITRDSVKNDNELSPTIYNETEIIEKNNLEQWVRECGDDRHHFRFIVSPENAHELDMTEYTQSLVKQMENDLETKLEYRAVNHYNTDNPHTHLIVRGVDDKGKDLVIHKDYIANGIRNRACEIATNRLGRRSELEIKKGITNEIDKERFTQIDRNLLTEAKKSLSLNGFIDLKKPAKHENSFSEFKRKVHIQRLKFLQKMELADEVTPGVWHLTEDCEKTLRELGMRNDIIKTMHKNLKNARINEHVIFDPSDENQHNITGVVIEKGLSNELYDEKFMIVSATDNRAYYVPLSKYSEALEFEAKPGSIVSISVKRGEGQQRISDKNIVDIASKNDGFYNGELHLKSVHPYRLPEGVTPEEYVENHLKRIEALEKRGVVERVENGWNVPENLTEKIMSMNHDAGVKANHVNVKLESMQDIHHQLEANAPTWLDKELAAGRLPRSGALQSTFSTELDTAKSARLEKLHTLGLADMTPKGVKIRPDYHEHLYKLQIKEACNTLSPQYGKPVQLHPDETFSGEFTGIQHLPSGPHVVLKNGNEFVLVPHQKGMERMKNIRLEMARQTPDSQQIGPITFTSLDKKELAKERGMSR